MNVLAVACASALTNGEQRAWGLARSRGGFDTATLSSELTWPALVSGFGQRNGTDSVNFRFNFHEIRAILNFWAERDTSGVTRR